MAANARPLSRPVPSSVPRSEVLGSPRQVNVGHLHLSAQASAPFWARRYTRLFLRDCSGITEDMAETAQLIVSELVTNATRASGGDLSLPARESSYSQRAGLGIIRLSLRQFREGLLIEVTDSSPERPMIVHADRDEEHGRGLMLVDALSHEWGFFPAPNGGKVVYAYLRLARSEGL
jgi:anti-sigma regulatory factor (Ser/Thr protein kinase)